jgi:iron complex outermembrane receptor protein
LGKLYCNPLALSYFGTLAPAHFGTFTLLHFRTKLQMPKIEKISFVLLIMVLPVSSGAQADTSQTILNLELGEVKITARKKSIGTDEVNIAEIKQFSKNNAADALQLVPGLSYSNSGPRNESLISVRGFDLRQVPVYIDGIPVYVTYDGYVDLGNYLVNDLAKISVSRGVSSILYGPNTLGGAINLVTRKPDKRFEFEGATGIHAEAGRISGWHSEAYAGSRTNKFYIQAGYSYIDNDSYSLSRKYDPLPDPDNRILDNSYRRNLKWNFKTGITPNTTDEYSISIMSQNGSRGIPLYAGDDPFQPVRFWQFPKVYNRGINLISRTALGPAGFLKTRFYYDQYYSDLRSYDNSNFSSQIEKSSFTSIYFDDSFGGSAEYHRDIGTRHNIKAVVHYKYDHHREHNTVPVEETVRHMSDQSFSAGMEENFSLSGNVLFIGGLSYNLRDNIRADNYYAVSDSVFPFPDNYDAALNAQIGLEYDFGRNQQIRISFARKTRFATMKDRYSYRLGRSLPNPSLDSESAFHIDLGYSASIGDHFAGDISLFTSLLNNTIQPVYGVDTASSSVYQMQNTGKACFNGLEADISYKPFTILTAGLQYTWIERKNLSHPEILFTDVPEHRIFGYLKFGKPGVFYILFDSGYNSDRYSNSNGQYVAQGFFLSNIKASVDILKALSFEASIDNLFDANYCYYEGYPEEGRNFNVTLKYSFVKE